MKGGCERENMRDEELRSSDELLEVRRKISEMEERSFYKGVRTVRDRLDSLVTLKKAQHIPDTCH